MIFILLTQAHFCSCPNLEVDKYYQVPFLPCVNHVRIFVHQSSTCQSKSNYNWHYLSTLPILAPKFDQGCQSKSNYTFGVVI